MKTRDKMRDWLEKSVGDSKHHNYMVGFHRKEGAKHREGSDRAYMGSDKPQDQHSSHMLAHHLSMQQHHFHMAQSGKKAGASLTPDEHKKIGGNCLSSAKKHLASAQSALKHPKKHNVSGMD